MTALPPERSRRTGIMIGLFVAGIVAGVVALRFRADELASRRDPAISGRTAADAPNVAPSAAETRSISRLPFVDPASRSTTATTAPTDEPEPIVAETPTVLTARLFDPLGAPIAGTYIDFRLDLARSEESFSLDRTDAEGVFRWRVGDGTSQVRAARQASFAVRPWTAEALTAVVRLDRPLEAGVDDLGSVTLTPPPLIVGGSVVDEFGAPHGGAILHVCLPVDGAAADAADSERFQPAWPSIRTTADAEGRFALRGIVPTKTLALLPAPVGAPMGAVTAVAAGAVPVRIVVPRGGSAVGRVLVDDPVACAELEVRAYRAVDDAEVDFVVPGADGAFRLNRLSPGRVRIAIARHGQVLFRCDDLLVVAGETVRDERLAAVDLRTGAKPIDVHVVDADGKPVFGARVTAGVDGGGVAEGTTGKDGRVRLLVPKPPVDIGVSYESYFEGAFRTSVVRGVTTACKIELKPGYPVFLVPRAKQDVPTGYRLLPWLFAIDVAKPEGWPFRSLIERYESAGSELRTGDDGRTTVAGPGRYRVRVDVRRPDGRIVTVIPEPEEIVVRDLEGEQRFELVLSTEEIEKALRILKSED